MSYYSTDYNKILEEENQKLNKAKAQKKDAVNKTYDMQANTVKDEYKTAIDDLEISYEDEYERNAVQKLINQKMIAEKNANLGLTDSGLNRTQQTAAQLSYSNAKGNIDLSRRKALDALSQNLKSAISTIEQNRIASLADLDDKFDAQAQSNAINRYNTNIEANTKIYQAQQSAKQPSATNAKSAGNEQQKIYWFRGVSDKNGNYLYYNTQTGKNEEVPQFMNPYTSNDNRIAYRAEYNDKNIGFFNLADGSVGYQPRGLKSEGGKFIRVEIDGKPLQFDLYGNGKYNSIWFSPSRHYWIWDDLSNSYKNMDKQVIAYMSQQKGG